MFNYVSGNPFKQKIESTMSTGQENQQNNNQNQDKKDEKNYLEDDDRDEVKIAALPILEEDDIIYLTNEYINNLKSEHSDNPKIVERLDKYLGKFDVKKFMKDNPDMTRADFHMIMFNETNHLIN